jgi:hypothetical protein
MTADAAPTRIFDASGLKLDKATPLFLTAAAKAIPPNPAKAGTRAFAAAGHP